MEFQIKTDLTTMPQSIEFNFEELKTELVESLNKYSTLVVTEDGIKEAKADRAKLNKLKTAVEDKRKAMKNLCLAPYQAFEAQCKELVALIEQPIKSIDGQLLAFDQKLQDEKMKQITEYYTAEVKELADVVPLERILPSNWKNKTEKLTDVCNVIGDTLDRIRTEMEMLEATPEEFKMQVTDAYLKEFSLTQAREEYKRLEVRKRQLEELERQKIEASKQKPETVPTPEVEPVNITQTPAPAEKPKATADEPLYSVTFKVTGTKAQILALKELMNNSEMNYEVIK